MNKLRNVNFQVMIGTAIAATVIITILSFAIFGIAHIEGHEFAVKETWGGVSPEVVTPGRYVYFRPTTDFIHYDSRTYTFVMNNKTTKEGEIANGREQDRYEIEIGKDSQKIWISLQLRWRYNIAKFMEIHKYIRNEPEIAEERIIRGNLMRVVKDCATQKEPMAIYSGKGLVALQLEIERILKTHPEFVDKGILIDGFVIEKIDLDPKFEQQIAAKQLAEQRTLRMKKETIANTEEALSEEAKAMIAYKRDIVTAEKNKQVGILEKEREKQARILNAEAEKQEQILSAEGKKIGDLEKAAGVLKLGLAQAEVDLAKSAALYGGESGKRRADVEIAKARVDMFTNMKAVVPEKLALTLLDKGFGENMKGFTVGTPE